MQALRRLPQVQVVDLDMCRFYFNLRGPGGLRHKKATRLLTSSQAVVSSMLAKKCAGKHPHEAVIGGSKVTAAAGHYTREFATSLVKVFEDQFNFETVAAQAGVQSHDCMEVCGSAGAVDLYHDVLVQDEALDEGEGDNCSDLDDDLGLPYDGEIPPAVRAAVKRVHEATGHRSRRRLARALLISGAPPAAVQAARELRCEVVLVARYEVR